MVELNNFLGAICINFNYFFIFLLTILQKIDIININNAWRIILENNDLQNLTDEELCALAQENNSNAENLLIARYVPLVKFRAAGNKNPYVETPDLVQEGLIGLLSAIRCFRRDGGASFSTYAYLCINRSMLHCIKKAVKRNNGSVESMVSLDELDHNLLIDSHSLPSLNDSDSTDKLSREHSEVLKKTLSPLEYKVLILYLSGYNFSEIASKLGKSSKSIYNAMQRMRAKLKQS